MPFILFPKQVVQPSMIWHNNDNCRIGNGSSNYLPFIFNMTNKNFFICFCFTTFSCMSNHWDGAQIYSCQSPRITTRVTPHFLLILPPLFRQMFGNTDAKREDDHNLKSTFIVLQSRYCLSVECVCVCMFLCERLHLIDAKQTQLIMTIYPRICSESCMLY